VRVNVDSQVVLDPRFKRAAKALKCSWHEVLGRCLAVWFACYERRSAMLPIDDVDVIAERDGFAAALVAADLAVRERKLVRLRGVTERIAFLTKQAERGRLGGIEKGKRSPSNRQANAKHSPAQALAQPPDQPLAQPQAEAREAELAPPSPDGWWPPAGGKAEAEARKRVAAGELAVTDVHACYEACERAGVNAAADAVIASWVRRQRPANGSGAQRSNGRMPLTKNEADYLEKP